MTAVARRTTAVGGAWTPGIEPMLATSCPCAVATSGAREQPGRDEEGGIDAAGPEAASRSQRAPGQPRVLRLATSTGGQDCALDRVPAGGERLLESADEDAVIGFGVPGVHLRDEQDP